MSQSEQQIEQEIQAKGLNAPRLTPADIDRVIVGKTFFTAAQGWNGEAASDERTIGLVCPKDHPLQLLTFCVLTLKNGFTVTGESACASPENFNEEIGKKIAYDNAREKIWVLEGYLLKQRLHEQPKPTESANAVITRSPDLSFSEALFALKKGCRVARTGWNAANQWLSVSNLDTATVPADRFWSPHNHEYAKENGGFAEVPPCITIKNAQGQVQMGWVPSQGDLFANDWFIVE